MRSVLLNTATWPAVKIKQLKYAHAQTEQIASPQLVNLEVAGGVGGVGNAP